MKVAIAPTAMNATVLRSRRCAGRARSFRRNSHADHRHPSMPNENDIDVSRNSAARRCNTARISVPKLASMWVKMLMVNTDCNCEKAGDGPPT